MLTLFEGKLIKSTGFPIWTKFFSEVIVFYKCAFIWILVVYEKFLPLITQAFIEHVILSEKLQDVIHVLESLPPRAGEQFDLLHPKYTLVLEFPQRFSSNGIPIRCWTVNDTLTVQRLIACTPAVPIEAIMTDDIDLAKQFPETIL